MEVPAKSLTGLSVLSDDQIGWLVASFPSGLRDVAFKRAREADWKSWRDIMVRPLSQKRPLCLDDLVGVPPDGTGRILPLPPAKDETAPTVDMDPVDQLPEADRPAVRAWVRYARERLGLSRVGPENWGQESFKPCDWRGFNADGRPVFYNDAPVEPDDPEPWKD